VVLLDVIYGFAVGFASFKTDIGTIAISINPLINFPEDLNNINMDTPENVLGAYYGTKIGDMNSAFGVRYGLDSGSELDIDKAYDYWGEDYWHSMQYLELLAGVAVDKNIDLGLSLSLASDYEKIQLLLRLRIQLVLR